jgi:hypothetical protein
MHVRGTLRCDGSAPQPRGPAYTFCYEGDEFVLEMGAEATVRDAKQIIAEKYESIADYVSLLFCGRNLRDESVLLRQRIGNGKIVVYIRSLDAILLQSVGYGSRRGAKKPANFLELVNRLERESGKDIRTCSRCLTFYDYEYDRALAALRTGDDE